MRLKLASGASTGAMGLSFSRRSRMALNGLAGALSLLPPGRFRSRLLYNAARLCCRVSRSYSSCVCAVFQPGGHDQPSSRERDLTDFLVFTQ